MPIAYRFAVHLVASCVLVACAHMPSGRAGSASDTRAVINPPGISPLVPAYSVAIRAGNQVFVSGMTGIKPGTQDIIEGGVAVQTRQTLENIRTSLVAAGATVAESVDLPRNTTLSRSVLLTARIRRCLCAS